MSTALDLLAGADLAVREERVDAYRQSLVMLGIIEPSPETSPAALAASHARIDDVERWVLANMELRELPLEHRFIGDLYVRFVTSTFETFITTKIHKTWHPFFLLRGKAAVSVPGKEPVEIQAPHFGITEPGTRRVILVLEDLLWVTVHAMTPEERDEPDEAVRLAMIEDRIIERRELDDGKTAHELFWEGFDKQQLAASERQEIKS